MKKKWLQKAHLRNVWRHKGFIQFLSFSLWVHLIFVVLQLEKWLLFSSAGLPIGLSLLQHFYKIYSCSVSCSYSLLSLFPWVSLLTLQLCEQSFSVVRHSVLKWYATAARDDRKGSPRLVVFADSRNRRARWHLLRTVSYSLKRYWNQVFG